MKVDIEKLADYLIEEGSYAFEHQDRELLEDVLQKYFDDNGCDY